MKKISFLFVCALLLSNVALQAARDSDTRQKTSVKKSSSDQKRIENASRSGSSDRAGISDRSAAKQAARSGLRKQVSSGTSASTAAEQLKIEEEEARKAKQAEWKSYIKKYKKWCEDKKGKFDEVLAEDAIDNMALDDKLCKLPVIFVCPEGLNSNTTAALAFAGLGVAGGVAAGVAYGVEQKEKQNAETAAQEFKTENKEFDADYAKYVEMGCMQNLQ